MLDVVILWYAFGALALLLLLTKLIGVHKRRSWVWFNVKGANGYLKPREKENEPSCAYSNKDSKNCVGYVARRNNDYADVYMVSRNETTGKENRIFLGTVHSDGRIFAGHDFKKYDPKKKKTEKYVFGYTAKLDDPFTPTCEIECKKIFKLFDYLYVFKGAPPHSADSNATPNADPDAAPNAAPESTPSYPENTPELPEENNAPLNADASEQNQAELPKPYAECQVTRFAKEDEDDIPEIVKTAAFVLLFREHNKKKTCDLLPEEKHGWRDTAFLATLVYTIVYLIFYAVYCAILEMPMIGQNYQMGATIAAFYFIVWAIMRRLKIYYESVTDSYSVQSRLNLLNKLVGMSPYSIIISVMAAISIVLRFVDGEHNYELLPLEIVVVFGVLLNFKQNNANSPWAIDNPDMPRKKDDEEADEEEDAVLPPEGNIIQNYEWELGSVNEGRESGLTGKFTGSVSLRFEDNYIRRIRQMNPFYMQRVDLPIGDYVRKMFELIKDDPEMMHRVRWVAQEIKSKAKDLHKGDFYQFVMDFVQEPNIAYKMDQESKPIDYTVKYIRFPDETLYDKEGDADCKSFLAAMIFYALGYNVLYMHSDLKKHALVGVEPRHNWYGDYFDRVNEFDPEKAFVEYNGHKYILCEVTGDQFHVGMPMGGIGVSDFETMVPFTQENVTNLQNTEMCHYKWNYTGLDGETKLYEFNHTFEQKDINKLRNENPFRDNSDFDNVLQMYKENLKEMNNFLNNNDDDECLDRLCNYIERESTKARFNQLQTLGFALSFVQQAIKQKRDDQSDILLSILEKQEMKEYVRFPEETLFDLEGDCDCKAYLSAHLFSKLGHNVIYLANNVDSHAAIAVEFNEDWTSSLDESSLKDCIIEHNGKKYLFCESTGSTEHAFAPGQISETMDIRDFKVVAEIPAVVRNSQN